MRVLHIFPSFAADLTNGAAHYQYMLTRKLAERGLDVEVWTTRCRDFRASAAFGLEWPDSGLPAEETVEGIRVRRFSASLSPSRRLGAALSRLILRRWEREDAAGGRVLPGSRNFVDELHNRALSRPRIYDWLSLLGRGPNPPGLWWNFLRHGRQYDVVLVGFAPFGLPWSVVHLARSVGTPCVVLPLFHPADPYHHFGALFRTFARADALLTQTAYSTSLLREWLPDAYPIEIGVGVDCATYRSESIDGARFRARHGLEEKRIVLIVGRKEPAKRWEAAVEAVDLLADERVKLVMIGEDVDAKPIESEQVLFLGRVEAAELWDAYDACEVLVHPSAHESFGFVFLEAWMREKPVIGNRACGPVSSVIEDGRDGFLVSDAIEMSSRIRELLDTPDLAARLGRAGRSKAETRYDWDAIAKRVSGLYADLASTRGG